MKTIYLPFISYFLISSVLTFAQSAESQFVLENPDSVTSKRLTAPLENKLLEFKAVVQDNKVNISWVTASETNNKCFLVQKSINGIEWEVVGEKPAGGNSVKMLKYAAQDEHPFEGTSYYRLKQMDYDGTCTYSWIETVVVKKSHSENLLYPNPASSAIHLSFKTLSDEDLALVRIYDKEGQLMKELSAAEHEPINVSELPSGIYTISVLSAGKISRMKWVKA